MTSNSDDSGLRAPAANAREIAEIFNAYGHSQTKARYEYMVTPNDYGGH